VHGDQPTSAPPRRRLRRATATAIALAGWAVVAASGLVLLSQAFAVTPTAEFAIVQVLLPYSLLVLVPVAGIAWWRRNLLLATASAGVAAGVLLLAAPLAFPVDRPDVQAGASGVTIASANLLFLNERVTDVAAELEARQPDVIVFNEFTAEHQMTLAATPLADTYLFRVERADGSSRGVAVWSRLPLDERDGSPTTFHQHVDVDVATPDGPLRVFATHLPTPIDDLDMWRRDLGTLADLGTELDGPTVVVGDLNASYWHPDFRQLLDAGLVDAHDATGNGFTVTWPTDRVVPPFVRLDHVLTGGALVATDASAFDLAGSDHRGVLVTVLPTR
jgi:endonuclease/exonuclease/phosphatase (EEP) superfamily protein YafD